MSFLASESGGARFQYSSIGFVRNLVKRKVNVAKKKWKIKIDAEDGSGIKFCESRVKNHPAPHSGSDLIWNNLINSVPLAPKNMDGLGTS